MEGLLAPFRARRARTVAWVLTAVVVVSVIALFLVVRPNAATTLGAGDYGIVLVFAAILIAILWRQATVSAVPDERGVTVRNLVFTRRVEWAEVVSVRFSADRAWAQLDVIDDDPIAVMAIQNADGARARDEAQRLATLVERYGGTSVND